MKFFYLMIFTILVDLIWLLFWGSNWNSAEYQSDFMSTQIRIVYLILIWGTYIIKVKFIFNKLFVNENHFFF